MYMYVLCSNNIYYYSKVHGIGNKSNETQEAEQMCDLLHAYWKVAAKRVIDYVPMTIDTEMLQPAIHQLQTVVIQHLGSDDHLAQKIFVEEENDRVLREELKKKIIRLESAENAILEMHPTGVPKECT